MAQPTANAAAPDPARFFLTDEWMVTWANPSASPWMAHGLNGCLWDTWPGARPIFEPVYLRALKDGHAVEDIFYSGRLLRIDATRVRGGLSVTFEILGVIDIMTIDSLLESLRRMSSVLPAQPGAPQPQPGLRLVGREDPAPSPSA